jgi:hypothetical protein
MDNLLDLFDQTFFAGERATGITCVLQCVWMYDRPLDLAGLQEFHRNLQRSRLSRRIERSQLPFGRHRWVTPTEQSQLEVAAQRPRAEFDAWLGEQAATPLDGERGPGWHLAMLPFTDGGTGVSLVISHALTDGVGLCEALIDAVNGRPDPVAWPAARSRTRRQALRQDIRQMRRDLPAVRDAIRAATGAARTARQGGGGSLSGATTRTAGSRERITIPTATVFLDADEWDHRAQSLGGTSNSLLEGFAARIAQKVGRTDADGSVVLVMPVNERTAGDTRANAVANVDITVDAAPAVNDLSGIRSATKQALTARHDVPDERLALLPLSPLLPRWLIRRMVSLAARSATTTASNLGAIDPDAYRADGSTADFFAMKSYGPGTSKAIMHRTGGILAVAMARVGRRAFVSILGYQPGRLESNSDLRQVVADVVRDFTLSATFDWPSPAPAGASVAHS